MTPRKECIDPRLDRVTITTERADDELSAPTVVRQRDHRYDLPRAVFFASIQQPACQSVVPVGEAIGLNLHDFAGDALDRKTAVINRRRDVFDDDPDAAIGGKRWHGLYLLLFC